MLIGQLSKETGVSVRSIRHYESKNLLHSRRLGNGYRDYEETALERVRLIKLCLGMGFTVREIGTILDCSLALEEHLPQCEAAITMYEKRLQEVSNQIDLMQIVQARLRLIVQREELNHEPSLRGGAV